MIDLHNNSTNDGWIHRLNEINLWKRSFEDDEDIFFSKMTLLDEIDSTEQISSYFAWKKRDDDKENFLFLFFARLGFHIPRNMQTIEEIRINTQ